MNWLEVLTIIGSLGGMMFFFLQRVEKDIGRIEKTTDAINSRLDKIDGRLDGHAQRIDQLYRMFVDLLKERK